MKTDVRDAVTKWGFVLIPEFAVGLGTNEAMGTLGEVVQADSLPEIHTLKPKLMAGPNTYSGNFGLGKFPLHTDLAYWAVPPRYLGLRCLVGADGVHTNLFDGNDLIDHIGGLRLQQTILQPRRLVANRRPLLRLLNESSEGRILRWDDLFIVPATPLSSVTLKEIRQYLDVARSQSVELLARGDTLIVDNWRMLHGRSSISPSAVPRHLERVYFAQLYAGKSYRPE